MRILVGVVLYLLLHFGLYAVLFRRLKLFRAEPAIFKYHLLSFLFMSVLLSVVAISTSVSAGAVLIGGMCLHAIYSMSFLEGWSLTEGSLYFRVLSQLADSQTIRVLGDVDSHRKDRARSLQRMKLVAQEGSVLRLTPSGHMVRGFLEFLAWLFAGKAP